MADDDGGGWVLAAIAVALLGAYGLNSPADASTDSPADNAPTAALAGRIGEQVSWTGVRVRSVPADEGFWVDTDRGRAWVQIDTSRESPYTVRRGNVVSFTGRVVAHPADYPSRVGVTGAEGGQALAAQGAHIVIAENALSIVR